MTKFKIVTGCLLFFFTLSAQAQKDGIRFFNGNWKKALAEAKESKKLIFVDVYAGWSIPCKKMEQEIYPLKVVGEKYNNHFINYQLDAEGREGVSFGRKYQVKGYPTYLYIDGNGDVVYRGGGYNDNPDWFLKMADTALYLYKAKETMLVYQATYESRKNDKLFLMDYINKLALFEMPEDTIDKVVDHFFSQLTPAELKDTLIAGYLLKAIATVKSPVFHYIISNQSFYSGFTPLLSATLGNVVLNSYSKAIATKDERLFQQTLAASSRVEDPPLKYPYAIFLFENQYYLTTGQMDQVITRASAFMDSTCRIGEKEMARRDQQQYENDMALYTSGIMDSTTVPDFPQVKLTWRNSYSRYVAGGMNRTAEIFLQHAKQKEDLQKACKWAAISVNMEPDNYSYYAVLAGLYSKVGLKREAVSTMESAIQIAYDQGAPEMTIQVYELALKKL
ncbi:thioredoxin fold domain-containing protein [Chitinophaga sp. SYP-B3965]|uniref:thioredoxin family protein n=1 Tax=Chitinophaga sp. SYP-B3965 TaxID=2663120 RepID=UPI0012996902|nr:thioredoxin family protein [Chitinophaga sp. SYP-B3965]MRG45826.1 thioredoxin fold domain-containing protein [Chitinophaga sp. SYP-B3965]